MIYLPYKLTSKQVPEAALLVPVENKEKNGDQCTLIISTTDVFDVQNSEHIAASNAIETRLVDQDLLPSFREFMAKY